MFYAYASLVVHKEIVGSKCSARAQRLGRMQEENMHSSNKMNNGQYNP